ncbi:MAG: hypothetical protein QJR13_03375 [Bacillota bacterium]|nr:hypothetical protein [Bacillota bacterium]
MTGVLVTRDPRSAACAQRIVRISDGRLGREERLDSGFQSQERGEGKGS